MQLHERQKVTWLAHTMRNSQIQIAYRDGMLEDLAELRAEIYLALGMFGKLFTLYASWLSREPSLYDPITAYESGQEAAGKGAGYKESVMAFFKEQQDQPAARQYYHALQARYNPVSSLLHALDISGLLREYTEEYRQIYGSVMHHQDLFFRAGYQMRGDARTLNSR